MGLISSKPGAAPRPGPRRPRWCPRFWRPTRLDIGGQEPHLARRQLVARGGLGRLVPESLHFEHLPVGPQPDLLFQAQPSIQHAHQNDHAAIRIEPRVENQRAQRRIERSLGRRHQVHDGLQDSWTPMPAWHWRARHRAPSRPITDSICSRMRSGSAEGRSILLITGMISRLWCSAR